MGNQEKEEFVRRSKGEGAIYRRKTGPKKGLWVAEYKVGTKRKYLYGKTKKAVTDKLKERLSSGGMNLASEADTMLVGAYLDRWLPTVRGTVKERTWRRHEEVVRLHLKPSLGKIRLKRLDALQIQSLYRAKLDSGLSPRTVQIIHTTLHKSLKQAVKWQLISLNIAEAVDPPRSTKKEIRPLNPEQVKLLLEVAKGTNLYALYLLAITTGMRQGELLGLKWEDVDLRTGTLQVRRTIFNGRVSAPKTSKGRRSIRLTEAAIQALQRHQRQGEWVFSSREGTPISCHNLTNRSWKPLLRKAGLPDTRFHDLRHTCATLLLTKGVHPKVVQEVLGHSNISITLDTYSHILPNMQKEAARVMEDLVDPFDRGVSPEGS